MERVATMKALLGLLTVLGAGCMADGGGPDSETTPVSRTSVPENVVVHSLDGLAVDPALFGGPLPQMKQFYVGEHGAVEPTIGIHPDGTAFYVASSFRLAGGASLPKPSVFRSSDEGRSWEDVTASLLPVRPPSPAAEPFKDPAFDADPFLHVDPVTGRVFAFAMAGVGSNCRTDGAMQWSDDHGETWSSRDLCGAGPTDEFGGDHPSIASGNPVVPTSGYPRLVYLCSSDGCRTSRDGGVHFGPPSRLANDEIASGCDIGFGMVEVGPEGTVYHPWRGWQGCGGNGVLVSRDEGASWENVLVSGEPWLVEQRPDDYDTSPDPSVAVDMAGNAYFLWINAAGRPVLAISRDAGRTWSPSMDVGAPDVTFAKYPSIAAGAEGRLAFLYMGSTVPGGPQATPTDLEGTAWHGYVGYTLNALDASPVIATTTSNPPEDPLKRGDCNFRCWEPSDERIPPVGPLHPGVFDFLDIDIDPASGRVMTALVDLCNDACARPEGTSSDPTEARAAVGVQVAGPSLWAERID